MSVLSWGRNVYWRLRAPIMVGVQGIIVHQGRVLLVRQNYGHRDTWHLPGGAVERKETLIEALQREIREEVNAEVQIERLHGVYYNFEQGASDHVIVFVASVDDPTTIKPNWEIAACEFFDLDALPASASPATRRRIEEYLEGAERVEYQPW